MPAWIFDHSEWPECSKCGCMVSPMDRENHIEVCWNAAKRTLAQRIVDVIVSHPDCSKSMKKDRESLEAAVEAKLTGK